MWLLARTAAADMQLCCGIPLMCSQEATAYVNGYSTFNNHTLDMADCQLLHSRENKQI